MVYCGFLLSTHEVFVTMRVERIDGTILKVEQDVRRNSQLLKAIYWLGLMISEQESKLKGPRI